MFMHSKCKDLEPEMFISGANFHYFTAVLSHLSLSTESDFLWLHSGGQRHCGKWPASGHSWSQPAQHHHQVWSGAVRK